MVPQFRCRTFIVDVPLSACRPRVTSARYRAGGPLEPEKAAEIIQRGAEAGKARILVGPDAYMFDILARAAPTHYFDVLQRLQSRLRARAQPH
jgi:hypothetical protein